MKNIINWKVFFILLSASVLSSLALLPYAFTLQSNLIELLPLPLHLFIFLQIIQTTILFAILIFVGLFLAKKVHFSTPVLHALVEGKDYKKILKSIFPISLILGIGTGFAIAITDWIFLQLGVSIEQPAVSPPIWQKLLASLYGGITEEVLMRLFLMTLLVWIGYTIKRTKENRPTSIGVWIAIIVSALIFGIGHLPVTASFTEITPQIITRGLILNGIGGIIFGWLYWRKGLESAIIAHFTTDIVLLVLIPLLFA